MVAVGDKQARGEGQVRPLAAVAAALLDQRGALFPWVAVAFGTGCALYFAWPTEPSGPQLLAIAAGGGAALLIMRPLGAAFGPLALGLAVVAAGLLMSVWRAQDVAAPVLGFRYYGPVEGRIVDVDRSQRDAVRLTLDRVVLDGVAPDRTPARVRVSLSGPQDWFQPVPGAVVRMTAHLSPPSGPAEPGDFDFRRTAWFERLGAVGYTRSPVVMGGPVPEGGWTLGLSRLRLSLSATIRSGIPGDAGGLAAAVMTGDRSGLSGAASDAMRDSNLYHIVSISGTHMAMVVAFVFAVVRYGVALVPPLALRVQAKKIAALVALPVATFYLALAGRDIATERAYIMAAVMLVAILLDRQALTMRGVAIAALIVLVLRPEAVVNPGFQMSFAAVAALVWAWRHLDRVRALAGPRLRWVLPVVFLLISSAIAGTATAPYAALHFNRMAHYGLVANALAMPVMGAVVMPGAVVYAALAPLGLGAPVLWVIGQGCAWVLWVAERVAALEGAVTAVPTPPGVVLPLITLGGLWVILWQGRARVAGVAALAVAAMLWAGVRRPEVLVAESGGLIGVLTPEGRALTRATGDGFAADSWAENDGSLLSREAAVALPAFSGSDRSLRVTAAGITVLQVRGEVALRDLSGCGGADVLILTVEDPAAATRPCQVFDTARLRATGSLAILPGPEGARILSAAELAGQRHWTGSTDSAPVGIVRAEESAADADRLARAGP